MKTQEQFLQEVLDLKKINPEMDIHFCVDSDEILEDCIWTAHKITNVEISPWFRDDGRIYTDCEDIQEHFGEMADPKLSEDEVERYVNYRYETEVKMAICVFTHAG